MFWEDASRPCRVTSPGGVTREHLERAACRCSAESSAVREHQADAAGSKRTGTRLTGARLMQPAGAVRRQRCGACMQTASARVLLGHWRASCHGSFQQRRADHGHPSTARGGQAAPRSAQTRDLRAEIHPPPRVALPRQWLCSRMPRYSGSSRNECPEYSGSSASKAALKAPCLVTSVDAMTFAAAFCAFCCASIALPRMRLEHAAESQLRGPIDEWSMTGVPSALFVSSGTVHPGRHTSTVHPDPMHHPAALG